MGIGVTAYGVLSRGLLSGSKPKGKGDFRAYLPRYKGDNYERNRQLIAELKSFADSKEATPTQLAIDWVLAKGTNIVPVIGARKRTQLEESLGALSLHLTPHRHSRTRSKNPSRSHSRNPLRRTPNANARQRKIRLSNISCRNVPFPTKGRAQKPHPEWREARVAGRGVLLRNLPSRPGRSQHHLSRLRGP